MKKKAKENLTVEEINQLIESIGRKIDQLFTRDDIQLFRNKLDEIHILTKKYMRMLEYHNEEILEIKQRLDKLEHAQKRMN